MKRLLSISLLSLLAGLVLLLERETRQLARMLADAVNGR